MNLDHLRAFAWLRWRLLANQVTKGHVLNKILLVFFAVGAVFSSIALFVGGVTVGALAFLVPDMPSWVMLVIWDGMVVVFLFAWSTGLLSELQRSEALSIDKFLHLPVSLAGVFVLNYFSSLLSVNLLMFVPMMLGFSLGLTISKGPAMLVLLPLLAAFLLMVTAVTYQFQGWLAAMMVNKRRRRAIIVMVTFGFILLVQLPNFLNLYFKPWAMLDKNEDELNKQQTELKVELATKAITLEEFQKRTAAARQEHDLRKTERDREFLQYAEQALWIASVSLPPGWLAVGAWSASEGGVPTALLCTLGMGLIGTASLWRCYRTTLRLYTGEFTAGHKRAAPAVVPRNTAGQPRPALMLERVIPWLSEPATVIALTTFRSLIRAPEAKMLLIAPFIMVMVFVGFISQATFEIPDPLRPLIAYGVMFMILFTLTQLVSNQFGYDRSGFKVYVLSPALRRDILLGKNLAILPLIAMLVAPAVIVVQFMVPLSLGYLLAVPFEFASMFMMLCLVANVVSILAPMPVASGTLKPVSPQVIPLLTHFALVLALPVTMAPVLLPWGIEAGLAALHVVEGLPICLALSALECFAILMLYRGVLGLQGRFLQYRELQILETVTSKSE